MNVSQTDRERFLEAYQWYKACADLVDQAHVSIRVLHKSDSPTTMPQADLGQWDPSLASSIAGRQHAMADLYEQLARAIHRQADAMTKTTMIASEIIAKLKAQDEA